MTATIWFGVMSLAVFIILGAYNPGKNVFDK